MRDQPIDLSQRIRHELNQAQVNEAVRRTNQLIFTMRFQVYRIYENLFPSQVNAVNHQEITAALAYLAGKIMGEKCPEHDLPEGSAILYEWLKKGIYSGLGETATPESDGSDS